MKVIYYFRNPIPGNYSIESIFNSIIDELKNDIDIALFKTKSSVDMSAILQVRGLKADVHHITGAVNYLALSLPSKNTVLTVHDIGFYENPVNAGLKKSIYGLFWLQGPLRWAKVITTVSEFTRQRLLEKFSLSGDKIRVIPNPILHQFAFQPPNVKGFSLRILQIGSGAHKNLKSLILASREMPVHLMIVGYPSTEEIQLMNRYRISFEIYKDIQIDDLLSLYRRCDVLFFASYYEGFGVPILEAQKVGRPVITSNFGAMKEITADSAYLVSPNDIEQIRHAIFELSHNHALYASLVEGGKKNADRFSLKEIAKKYLDVYKTLNNGD